MTGMYLEHYGVLGMKWGVRKEDEKRNASSKNRKPNESNESKY